MIQLFTKPECQPCRRVKAILDESGVPYEVHDASESDWAADVLKEHDIKSVPAILSWTHPPIVGLRPDALADLIKTYKEND